ncbi:MAG TPA: HlyD family efflux transporter periplasmic adaptor subunit [Actinoplanes sp.]|nr:HlyD family efflux transporter periplasmic adaptor subunit [Actinoplanes sp.]
MITVEDAPAVAEPVAEPAPVAPARPLRLRRFLRALRTFVVVLVLLAAAVVGGAYIVQQRQAANAYVDLGAAVLTAQPVGVGTADAGVVRTVAVREGDSVTAGAELGRVALTATGVSPVPRIQILTAPVAGIVSSVAVGRGGIARAGEPVITLYNPAALTFRAEVPLEQLRKLRLGMTTYVDGTGLDRRVTTILQDVVPQVGVDPAQTGGRLVVVLVPVRADAAVVRSLVPGLRFNAVADTTTAPGGTPAVNSA